MRENLRVPCMLPPAQSSEERVWEEPQSAWPHAATSHHVFIALDSEILLICLPPLLRRQLHCGKFPRSARSWSAVCNCVLSLLKNCVWGMIRSQGLNRRTCPPRRTQTTQISMNSNGDEMQYGLLMWPNDGHVHHWGASCFGHVAHAFVQACRAAEMWQEVLIVLSEGSLQGPGS